METIPLSLSQAILATILTTFIVLAERAFPFALFSKHEVPSIIRFIEKYIPPMIMAALLVYCLKDINFSKSVNFIPEIAGIFVTAILYLWKHNSLLSIFGATAIYMILIRIL